MAELQLLSDDQLLRRYSLRQGGITIGRAPDNQIQLDSPAVNERHARIFTVGSSSVIQDLTSESGTYINNKEIARQTLFHDDLVQIGSFRLRFAADGREDEAVPAAAQPQKPAPAVPPAATPAPPAAVPATPSADHEPASEPLPVESDSESEPAAPTAPHSSEADIVTPPTAATRDSQRIDTALKAKAVEDAMDDFENTLASEVDLDLIVDSETLIETTDGVLSSPAAVDADDEPSHYPAGDPADAPNPIPDFGEPTDEMAAVIDEHASPVASSTEAEFADSDREPAAPQSKSAAAKETVRAAAAADDDEEDDPVAAAIRARIQAKVSANVHLQQEITTTDDSTAAPAVADDEATELDLALPEDEDDATEITAADSDDEPDTILEIMPEPRRPLPPMDSQNMTPVQILQASDDNPQPAPREQSVELPAPPNWSLEGDEAAVADAGAGLSIQGESSQGARYAAVDIMNGPNAGLRIWLGKARTILGNQQDRAVIIERHPAGFRVAATHRGNTVTVNGTLLLSTPENLHDGDRIEFANTGLKFIVTDVRPAHPDELQAQADAESAAAAQAPSASGQPVEPGGE